MLVSFETCHSEECSNREQICAHVRAGESGRRRAGRESPAAQRRFCPRGPRTLTGVPGQPGADADLQHLVTGLEDGQVTKALVELHLPGAPCTPGTPVLLFQLEFKPVTSKIVGINKLE